MPNYSYLIAFVNREKVVLMAERYAWLISDFSEESRMSAEMRVWKCEFGSFTHNIIFVKTGRYWLKKIVVSCFYDS